jgi:hypothetical protein
MNGTNGESFDKPRRRRTAALDLSTAIRRRLQPRIDRLFTSHAGTEPAKPGTVTFVERRKRTFLEPVFLLSLPFKTCFRREEFFTNGLNHESHL